MCVPVRTDVSRVNVVWSCSLKFAGNIQNKPRGWFGEGPWTYPVLFTLSFSCGWVSGDRGNVKIMFYNAESAHGSESWKFVQCLWYDDCSEE